MTARDNNRSDRVALERLADILVEDILNTPDAYLLSEAEACDDDGARIARAAFHKVLGASRKHLSRVVSELPQAWRASSAKIRALDPATARQWLAELGARDPETARKLTAAREGRDLSDEDVYGLLESLQKRGALGPLITGHERG